MGNIWLNGSTPGYPNIVTVLRDAGVRVNEYSGWATRSRSSGGLNKFMGIFAHHTASNTTPQNDLAYMVNGSPDAPVSNGLLDRDGVFWIIAGGASNHAGKGGGSDSRPPWNTSKGQVPVDSGNSNTFGIECANAGTGQAYPVPQQDAYVLMCRAICNAYGLVPATDIIAHWEWTSRKCDPTGPARFCDGNRNGCNGACRWNMDIFRNEVAAGGGTLPPPTPTGDLMLTLFYSDEFTAKFMGLVDSRGFGHTISWIDNEDIYKWYKDDLKTRQQKVALSDIGNLFLVGMLPEGDGLHQWRATDFAPWSH